MKTTNRYVLMVAASLVLPLASGSVIANNESPETMPDEEGKSEMAADARVERSKIDEHAETVLNELFERSDAAEDVYDEAAGYAVFDSTKAGLILTGGGGKGVAVDKASDERVYMNMGTGGVGIGAGIQKFQLVMMFETEEGLGKFIDGGWDSAVSAQAAAGKAGTNFASSFVDGVAVYQLTEKGLMAQADLTGTRFWTNKALNQ